MKRTKEPYPKECNEIHNFKYQTLDGDDPIEDYSWIINI